MSSPRFDNANFVEFLRFMGPIFLVSVSACVLLWRAWTVYWETMHKVIREELGAPSAQPDDIVFNRAYDPAIDRGLSKDCIARAPSEPAASSVPPQETPGLNGILWRCYHALKAVEWAYDDDITLMDGCPYCGCSRKHDDDCMVGNALKAMDEFVWASSVPVEQTKDKR